MASNDKSRQIEARLEGLMGRPRLSTDAVQEAVRELRRTRAAEMQARHERQVRAAELRETIVAPMLAATGQDDKVAGAMKDLAALGPAEKVALSRVILPVPWLNTSPITVTQTPPYSYVWNEPYQVGQGVATIDIEPSQGTVDLRANAARDGDATADCLAGFGIYFYPPARTGRLDIWCAPVSSWSWKDWAVLASAGSYCAVDLFVVSLDLKGQLTGAPIDPFIFLWNDESTLGNGDGHRTDSAVPLAGSIQVDNSHQYLIWVRWDIDAAAYGHGIFSSSGAHAQLAGVLPFITWSFTGDGALVAEAEP